MLTLGSETNPRLILSETTFAMHAFVAENQDKDQGHKYSFKVTKRLDAGLRVPSRCGLTEPHR